MNLGDMGKINAAYPSVAHCNQVSKNGWSTGTICIA